MLRPHMPQASRTDAHFSVGGGFHRVRNLQRLLPLLTLVACSSTGPAVPYPAFMQVDELPDVFLASFPGIRAKQFSGNTQTRGPSGRLQLPAEWSGTTGGDPSKSVELFILAGDVTLGDVPMTAGGYAWFPAGSRGVNLRTARGALLLYFLVDADAQQVIQTPLVTSSDLESWLPGDQPGLSVKVLRDDPGSGARTWLLRVTPEATLPWQRRARILDGYLLSGRFRDSECVSGKPVTSEYAPGGYFQRPANAVHGGPRAMALETSVWLLRIGGAGDAELAATCREAGGEGR